MVQSISGGQELVGPEVVLAHRLLKTGAAALVGYPAYALITDPVVAGAYTHAAIGLMPGVGWSARQRRDALPRPCGTKGLTCSFDTSRSLSSLESTPPVFPVGSCFGPQESLRVDRPRRANPSRPRRIPALERGIPGPQAIRSRVAVM